MTTQAHPVRFIPSGFTPTQEQRDIQLSQHKVSLIQANAGAAKTTTLALRIGEAIARGLAPEKILALVFTPEARIVMQARLQEIGIPYATAVRIQVQTLEEFSARVLAAQEDHAAPLLAAAKDLKEYALEALEGVSRDYAGQVDFLDIRTHDIAISQFLDYQTQLKATMALQRDGDGLGLEDIAIQLGLPLTDYLATLEYERIRLQGHGGVMFRGPHDATYDLARSLHDNPELRSALPDYRLVVGDELHDLNEASFQILEALLTKEQLYFVGAGDKDQVIHSRLGADEQYLNHRFADSFPGVASYPLTLTYRHGPHLAYAMAAFKQKTVESSLPLTTVVAEHYYDHHDPDACAGQVVAAIQTWQADKLPLHGCAILLRERHQSIAVENALMRADIAYRMLGMPSYLQREEILFLRGMMAIALKNLASVQAESVRKSIIEALAIFGELAFTPQDMEYAKDVIAKDPQILSSFFSGQLQNSASEQARTRIASAVAYMEGLDNATPACTALQEVCRLIDTAALAKRIYVHPRDAAVVAKSVEGFISVARKLDMSLRQFSEWIGAAEAFITPRRRKHLVSLQCVANAKGQEFDHIILPFLENGEFPDFNRDNKEEENLFYVAATRSKLRLSLIAPDDVNQRSAFISRMQLSAIRKHAEQSVRKNQSQTKVSSGRFELAVPYAEKNLVKALGAQWDPARQVWYVKEGADIKPFQQWFPNP